MVVLTIISIVMVLGIPSLRAMIQRHQLGTAATDLLSAVHLARAEAIRRGVRVDLIPAENGISWSRGWVILIDENRNQRSDPGEEIIFSRGAFASELAISASFSDSARQYLAYNGQGRSRTNASSQAPQLGSWTLSLGAESRKVVINFVGRPRICDPKLKSGPSTC
jgi:type IV fimbrial biogenesis protein FimT